MTAFSEMSHNGPRNPRASRFVQIARIVPLFGPVLAVYALLTVSGLDLTQVPIHIPLISGATLDIAGKDLFLIAVVLLLFFELIKASNATQQTVFIEHNLSTLVFDLCSDADHGEGVRQLDFPDPDADVDGGRAGRLDDYIS